MVQANKTGGIKTIEAGNLKMDFRLVFAEKILFLIYLWYNL